MVNRLSLEMDKQCHTALFHTVHVIIWNMDTVVACRVIIFQENVIYIYIFIAYSKYNT